LSQILLLGEFSGLHTNLKEGLEELGHSALLVSSGDGVKNIKRDTDISVEENSFIEKIEKYYTNRKILKSLKNYEVVQFINPYIKPRSTLFSYFSILNNNEKKICLAAGTDIYVSEFLKRGGMSKYSPFDEDLKNNKKLPYDSIIHKHLQKKILKQMDLIIPTSFEYAEAYRQSELKNKLTNTIPFPINTNKIEYVDNKIIRKIIIYHASNRPITKGSYFIIEAMRIIEKKYPNDVEIICADYLPLDKYLETINKAHIVIDQCRSYSYAMNALYSMAKGKIVLSGNEPESLNEFGIENSPVVNIVPNINQIVQQLENIIENKHQIEEIGMNSRMYVENYHNHIGVAKKYLKAWGI
jgi:glycosyltransferase involved in cell wall biosynthesis